MVFTLHYQALLALIWCKMVPSESCTLRHEDYLFATCPPSRRFETTSNRSLWGPFVPTGQTHDSWLCGRETGLRLRDQQQANVLSSRVSWSQVGVNFTISLRFQPETTDTQALQTIFILTTPSSEGWDQDGCQDNLLQVGQYGTHIFLRYQEAGPHCKVLLLREADLSVSATVQLTLVVGVDEIVSYVNGEMVATSTGLDFPSATDGMESQVHLFGSSDEGADHFRGSLFALSAFDRRLTATEVGTLNGTTCGEIIFPVYDLPDVATPEPLVIGEGSNESHSLSFPRPYFSTIEYEILSQPRQGILRWNDEPVPVGSRIKADKASLEYELTNTQYFNQPHVNVHGEDLGLSEESFSYRLLLYDDDGFVNAKSRVLEFPVVVQNVNHRPLLQAPPRFQQSKEDRNLLIATGILLLDPDDYDLNRVRVDVHSGQGRMSLPEESRSSMLAYACGGRTASAWQCVGGGRQDRRLTFVAAPSDVTRVLNRLEYRGLVAGLADNVTIIVYDGQGGECLTASEHWQYQQLSGNRYPSLHRGCNVVRTVIEVPAMGVESVTGGSTREGNGSIVPDVLFWLVCLLALCCFGGGRLRKCAMRGSAVDADGGSVMPRIDEFPTDISVASSLYSEDTGTLA